MTGLFRQAAAILLASLLTGVAGAAATSDDPIAYGGQFPTTTTALTASSLTVGNASRDVLVYRPASATSLPPVLIFFSGTGATLAYSTADEIGRDWLKSFADREGVILVFPLPLTQSHGDWDNHSMGTPYWETATGEGSNAAVSSDPDSNPDLLLTRAIIKEAIVRYGADGSRIYASGFSNGAMFSYFVAMILNNRIAAFAEIGGGLILSNTTAGEPSPCNPPVNAGSAGSLRSCAETGWVAGTCQAAGATARPVAVPASGRVPPGFLRAHDDDSSVPYAHTCNLADALAARGDVSVSIAHQAGGHIVTLEFLESSWSFFKSRTASNADGVLKEYLVSDGSYFYSALPAEQQTIESGQLGPGWSTTGNSFKVWIRSQPLGSYPVCRFRGDNITVPGYGHFYTALPSECEGVRNGSAPFWVYEGIGFYTYLPTASGCPSGTSAVYRQYNAALHNHHFQIGNQLTPQMQAVGWTMEGIPFCAGN